MKTKWPVPNQLFTNEKPGIRYYLIMAALPQLPPDLDQQAYYQEALKIRNAFDEQVTIAKKHHDEGRIALAVPIFEELVEDGYDQIYPYTYLKEHYSVVGDQEGAQRTIKAFRELTKSFEEKGINRPDLVEIDEAFIKKFY